MIVWIAWRKQTRKDEPACCICIQTPHVISTTVYYSVYIILHTNNTINEAHPYAYSIDKMQLF